MRELGVRFDCDLSTGEIVSVKPYTYRDKMRYVAEACPSVTFPSIFLDALMMIQPI